MSDEELTLFNTQLEDGLRLAEYRMLRDKAMRNQTIVVGNRKGDTRLLSARDEFVRLYHEPVPTF